MVIGMSTHFSHLVFSLGCNITRKKYWYIDHASKLVLEFRPRSSYI